MIHKQMYMPFEEKIFLCIERLQYEHLFNNITNDSWFMSYIIPVVLQSVHENLWLEMYIDENSWLMNCEISLAILLKKNIHFATIWWINK